MFSSNQGHKSPAESNPDYWRDRARAVRLKADVAKDPRSKRMLGGIAEAYERLAQQFTDR